MKTKATWNVLLLSLCVLSFVLSSCRTTTEATERVVTREVPVIVERTHTDTVRLVQEHRDSIYIKDSVYRTIERALDTTYITTTKWKIEYRDRIRYRDSVRVKVDTIQVPVEVHDTTTVTTLRTLTEYRTPLIYKVGSAIGLIAIASLIAYVWARWKHFDW